MNIAEILRMILTDDLGEAIKAMLTLAGQKKLTSQQNILFNLSGQYHGNERQRNEGTLSDDFYQRTRNRIRNSLKETLKDFPGWSNDIVEKVNLELATGSTGTGSSGSSSGPAPESNAGLGGKSTGAGASASSTGDGATRILMLSANPTGTAGLQLEKEFGRISARISEKAQPGQFIVKHKKAVTLTDFQDALMDEKPNIVHFSGHGERDKGEVKSMIRRGFDLSENPEKEKGNDAGLLLMDEDKREPMFVSSAVIRRIFKSLIERNKVAIQAVIFNACYSEAQAQAVAEVVPYVIGTTWNVGDEAAIAFATGFYGGIARGQKIEDAWDSGVTQALAYNEPENLFALYMNGKKTGT